MKSLVPLSQATKAWISPEGSLYPFRGEASHSGMAFEIQNGDAPLPKKFTIAMKRMWEAQSRLLGRGWVKVHFGDRERRRCKLAAFGAVLSPTLPQRKKLLEICYVCDFLPMYFNDEPL